MAGVEDGAVTERVEFDDQAGGITVMCRLPAWLISVARRKAIDDLPRESLREGKERAAVMIRDPKPDPLPAVSSTDDDELPLLYLCCHPALNPAARSR